VEINMKANIIICKRKTWKLIIKGNKQQREFVKKKTMKILANCEFESIYKLENQNKVQKNLTLDARRQAKQIIPGIQEKQVHNIA
jgi:hypothetical protein